MNFISYGAGLNSTAMILEMIDRKVNIDLILFADTKAERPDTYKFINIFQNYLRKYNLKIIIVSNKITLYEDCVRRKALPSLAYGFKTCSQRFKQEPQKKFINNFEMSKNIFKEKNKINRFIGFDVNESHRIKNYEDKKYNNIYPLVEWTMTRNDCRKTIKKHNLPLPGKSSCFFCPAMKKTEIIELNKKFPGLFKKAIKLENNANLTNIKGLGRYFSWENVVKYNTENLFPETLSPDIICECYD